MVPFANIFPVPCHCICHIEARSSSTRFPNAISHAQPQAPRFRSLVFKFRRLNAAKSTSNKIKSKRYVHLKVQSSCRGLPHPLPVQPVVRSIRTEVSSVKLTTLEAWPLMNGCHCLLLVTLEPDVLRDVWEVAVLTLLNRLAKWLIAHLLVFKILRSVLQSS